MLKKILVVILLGIMCFSFVGCNLNIKTNKIEIKDNIIPKGAIYTVVDGDTQTDIREGEKFPSEVNSRDCFTYKGWSYQYSVKTHSWHCCLYADNKDIIIDGKPIDKATPENIEIPLKIINEINVYFYIWDNNGIREIDYSEIDTIDKLCNLLNTAKSNYETTEQRINSLFSYTSNR